MNHDYSAVANIDPSALISQGEQSKDGEYVLATGAVGVHRLLMLHEIYTPVLTAHVPECGHSWVTANVPAVESGISFRGILRRCPSTTPSAVAVNGVFSGAWQAVVRATSTAFFESASGFAAGSPSSIRSAPATSGNVQTTAANRGVANFRIMFQSLTFWNFRGEDRIRGSTVNTVNKGKGDLAGD
jgi:hypothetical protein